MENVFVYYADLPPKINEMVAPCADGFTVYIDEKLSPAGRQAAYLHALQHIKKMDFEGSDVQKIESDAHSKDQPPRQ